MSLYLSSTRRYILAEEKSSAKFVNESVIKDIFANGRILRILKYSGNII